MPAQKPRLLKFSEFIVRNEQRTKLDQRSPESTRVANRQLSEQLVNDETIDYIHSQIPFDGDDDKKRQTVEDISTTLARFIDMGDVLIFAICVRAE